MQPNNKNSSSNTNKTVLIMSQIQPRPSSNIIEQSRTLLNQQVESFLCECGLSQYFDIFIEEGFDRLESLIEITESDLIQMQVKRGHRRLLQRAVANAKGIPASVPLNITPIINNKDVTDTTGYQSNKKILQTTEAADISLQFLAGSPITSSTCTSANTSSACSSLTPNNYQHTSNSSNNFSSNEYFPSAGTMTHNTQSGMSSTEEEAVTSENVHRLWKRKYHRHAKPDTNAPLKPPSAYVMFSNDVRAELKQQNKSFTDLAKIIGDRWKNISPEEKELYETNALRAREDYLQKIEEYQKTDSYKKYQQYLSDFKAENEAAARPVGRPRKRHRRDEDKYGSDDTVSDSTRPRRTSTSSQPEQQQKPLQSDSIKTSSSDHSQRQYPFYLLNEDSTQQTTEPNGNNQ